MNCSTCSTFLADGIAFCPQCGMPTTPYSHEVRPDDSTSPASYAQQQPIAISNEPAQHVPPPPPPYTNNGPYGTPPLYHDHNKPPSDKAKKGPNVALVTGTILLLIVLLGGGLTFLFRSQLSGLAIHQATVTAVLTAPSDLSKNPYPPRTGTLIINDPMQDNSKGYEWNEITMYLTNEGTDICGFNNGAYQLTLVQNSSLVCRADAPSLDTLSNIAYEAQLTITRGDSSDSGLAFRINPAQKVGYIFAIGVAGDYVIAAYNVKVQSNGTFTILRKGSSAAIKRGWNQTNLVAIVANRSTISAYVNNQLVDYIQDNTHQEGRIGLYGSSQTPGNVDAKNVRVWKF